MPFLLLLLLFATPQAKTWSGIFTNQELKFNAAVSVTTDNSGRLLSAVINRSATKCWKGDPVKLMGHVDSQSVALNSDPNSAEVVKLSGSLDAQQNLILHLSSKGTCEVEADGVLTPKK